MQFHEQLDYLMKLTDISNSELSKRANIDPSLVSRWRRGLKRPEVFSDIVSHIAEILAQRINSDLRGAGNSPPGSASRSRNCPSRKRSHRLYWNVFIKTPPAQT